jgi:hypothetical protein
MSCPLLEKVAPETRDLIYGYLLTFDSPLKHLQEMRPFLQKSGQGANSRVESTSKQEPAHTSESIERIDVSILTTSKLIYTEAISTFYKSNIITVDAPICKPENISALRGTDLALATQVVTKISLNPEYVAAGSRSLAECMCLATHTLPSIFPKLISASVCVYTDAFEMPVTKLFRVADVLRDSAKFDTVRFEGIGSVAAYSTDHPGLKFIAQCKLTIERQEQDEIPPPPDAGAGGLADFLTWSTKRLQRESQGLPCGTVTQNVQKLLNSQTWNTVVPPGYGVIDTGSHEFWTVIGEVLREMHTSFHARYRRLR